MIDCRTCKGTGKVPDNHYSRCDTAIAHGPGHQSISPCEVEGPHDEHQAGEYSWADTDLTPQTYDKKEYAVPPEGGISVWTGRILKTYRLTFSRDW